MFFNVVHQKYSLIFKKKILDHKGNCKSKFYSLPFYFPDSLDLEFEYLWLQGFSNQSIFMHPNKEMINSNKIKYYYMYFTTSVSLVNSILWK